LISAYLHFGEISPNYLWHKIKSLELLKYNINYESFCRELGWREFSYYLLYHFPMLPSKNFNNKFDNFPWQNDMRLLESWQKGGTGIPIVDAGTLAYKGNATTILSKFSRCYSCEPKVPNQKVFPVCTIRMRP
jgi:deoxyribodipyrimidine photolyase